MSGIGNGRGGRVGLAFAVGIAAGLLVVGVGFCAGRLTTRPFQQRLRVPLVRRLIPATRT